MRSLVMDKRPRTTPSFAGLGPSSAKASAAARGSSQKRDTKCELLLRRELTRLGLRYRVRTSLPGQPDVVFAGPRVAVFCDGDFWHGRNLDRRLSRLGGGHNGAYWVAKIRTNVARDQRVTSELEAAGWLVLRFWEGDLRCNSAGFAAQVHAAVSARRSARQSIEQGGKVILPSGAGDNHP